MLKEVTKKIEVLEKKKNKTAGNLIKNRF